MIDLTADATCAKRNCTRLLSLPVSQADTELALGHADTAEPLTKLASRGAAGVCAVKRHDVSDEFPPEVDAEQRAVFKRASIDAAEVRIVATAPNGSVQ